MFLSNFLNFEIDLFRHLAKTGLYKQPIICNSMELISEVLREVSTKVILYNSMAEVLYIDKPLIRQIEQGNSLKKNLFQSRPNWVTNITWEFSLPDNKVKSRVQRLLEKKFQMLSKILYRICFGVDVKTNFRFWRSQHYGWFNQHLDFWKMVLFCQ